MRPQTTSVTGVGFSPWLSFDYVGTGAVALQIDVDGDAVWALQSTLSDLQNGGPVVPYYSDDITLTGQNSGRQGNYIAAPRACRIQLLAGTGTVTLTAIQYSGRGS